MLLRSTRRGGRSLSILLVALGLAAAFASAQSLVASASAQTAAVCDQYPDLPQCSDAGGLPSDDAEPGEVPAATHDPAAPPGSGNELTGEEVPASATSRSQAPPGTQPSGAIGKGEFPFTGYPLTPLILVFVLLLALGLAARAYLAMRKRLLRGGDSAESPLGP